MAPSRWHRPIASKREDPSRRAPHAVSPRGLASKARHPLRLRFFSKIDNHRHEALSFNKSTSPSPSTLLPLAVPIPWQPDPGHRHSTPSAHSISTAAQAHRVLWLSAPRAPALRPFPVNAQVTFRRAEHRELLWGAPHQDGVKYHPHCHHRRNRPHSCATCHKSSETTPHVLAYPVPRRRSNGYLHRPAHRPDAGPRP